MSKHEKLLQRIAATPKDFTWSELVSLMSYFGVELRTSSGSARRFINPTSGQAFYIHQPHPSNVLKPYQVREVVKFLKQEGFLA
jgi:hypothetical protein